jgi:uracil-DNA glycosylase family protein
MAQASNAAPWVPSSPSIPKLVEASKHCEGCDLYRHATQTVFGEGPENAAVVLIGEQPGDQEDLAGKPFVGPAGKLLDKALAEAGLDRSRMYVTNAVKHFKFEERGKRRIHAKPNTIEIAACRPWLEAEVAAIHPELIVCLGATAAQALMGKAFRVTQDRGRLLPHPWANSVLATIHPSALLRVTDSERRASEYAQFVQDLRVIQDAVGPI